MAYIDNSDTKKEMNDAMRGNAVSNIAPTKINDSVQPVININPKDYRKVNIVKQGNNGTIYTTPSDKDFYLTGYHMACASTTAGNNTLTLSVTLFGDTSATSLSVIPSVVTAATDASQSVSDNTFSPPILLARNSTITLATAGTLSVRNSTITGYTVEP